MFKSYQRNKEKNAATNKSNAKTLIKDFEKISDDFIKSIDEKYQQEPDFRRFYNDVNTFVVIGDTEAELFKEMHGDAVNTLKSNHPEISEQLDKFYNDTLVAITRYERVDQEIKKNKPK